jgi:ParB-like chromosome segregation protein Spo0J
MTDFYEVEDSVGKDIQTGKVGHDLKVETVAIDVIDTHPDNPRRGNVDAIAESLETTGQYRPLIVSGETNYVLAGNHTLLAARKLGWGHIQVVFLSDLTPEAERRILAVDNRTADLGTYDDAALIALLESLDDLGGTGYTIDDLETLQALAGQEALIHNAATDAHYSGSDEERAQHADNVANYQPMKAQGLEEVILVLTTDKKEQLINWLQLLRVKWGDQLTNGELVYAAVGRAVDGSQ